MSTVSVEVERNLHQQRWYVEDPAARTDAGIPATVAVRGSTVVAVTTTGQHKAVVLDGSCGKSLILDGFVHVTMAEWSALSEQLTFTALCACAETPKRVLVVGGGDGACVHQALQWPGMESVDVLESDPELVRLCCEHFPFARAALEHPKVKLVAVANGDICDSLDAVKECRAYNAVIIDTRAPIGAAVYAHLTRVVAPGGVVVVNAGSGTLDRLVGTLTTSKAAGFADVRPMMLRTPSAVVGWTYAVAMRVRQAAVSGVEETKPVNVPQHSAPEGTEVYAVERHAGFFDLAPRDRCQIETALALAASAANCDP